VVNIRAAALKAIGAITLGPEMLEAYTKVLKITKADHVDVRISKSPSFARYLSSTMLFLCFSINYGMMTSRMAVLVGI
jgi:hypothetical protein